MIFLDTNIILRFVLQDHPIYSPKSKQIFSKIDQSKVKVFISWLVVFETVFVLQNSHKLTKNEISSKLLPLLSPENIILERKNLLKTTFNNYLEKNISLADAYHIALMHQKKIKQIYSFDRDFDKFLGIKRLES